MSALPCCVAPVPANRAMPAPSEDEFARVRAVPRDRRIARFNELASAGAGANAAGHYDRADQVYVALWIIAARAKSEDERRLFEQLNHEESRLATAVEWNGPEQRGLRDYLERNLDALDALRAATAAPRLSRTIREADRRFSDAVIDRSTSYPLSLVRLMSIKANACAHEGRWKEAYEWNARIYRVATHLYQQPFGLDHLVALSIQLRACQQTLRLLARNAPADLDELSRAIVACKTERCSSAILDETAHLFLMDELEAWYSWANDPTSEPKQQEMAEFLYDEDGMGKDLGKALRESRPNIKIVEYESVADFRAAFRAPTIDREWDLYQELIELSAEWVRQPFVDAWRQVAVFESAFRRIAAEGPVLTATWLSLLSISPSEFRFRQETSDAYLRAVITVIALHGFREKEARWPRILDELTPAYPQALPTDPFSGRPMKYRLVSGDQGFVLYSVGPNQRDDGGTHNSEWRPGGDHVFWPPQ